VRARAAQGRGDRDRPGHARDRGRGARGRAAARGGRGRARRARVRRASAGEHAGGRLPGGGGGGAAVKGAWAIVGYAFRESLRRRVVLVVCALTVAFLALYALGVHFAFQEVESSGLELGELFEE